MRTRRTRPKNPTHAYTYLSVCLLIRLIVFHYGNAQRKQLIVKSYHSHLESVKLDQNQTCPSKQGLRAEYMDIKNRYAVCAQHQGAQGFMKHDTHSQCSSKSDRTKDRV